MKYKYVSVDSPFSRRLSEFPSAGPHPNIKGMRNLYWGHNALIIKCGAYAYNVSSEPMFFHNAK